MSYPNQDMIEECISFPTYKNRMGLFEVLPPLEDAVLFLGDSLTQRNQWSEFFGNLRIVNRGIDSDRTGALLQRLDGIVPLQPRKIFLMIGINDIYDNKETNLILNRYEMIINQLHKELPNTRLYVQSLLPVNNSVYKHPLNNETILQFNTRLADLCSKYSIPFIDLFKHFLQDHEMDAKYTDDGCHLTGLGYHLWVNLIRSSVQE